MMPEQNSPTLDAPTAHGTLHEVMSTIIFNYTLRPFIEADNDVIAEVWHVSASLPGIGPPVMPTRQDLRARMDADLLGGGGRNRRCSRGLCAWFCGRQGARSSSSGAIRQTGFDRWRYWSGVADTLHGGNAKRLHLVHGIFERSGLPFLRKVGLGFPSPRPASPTRAPDHILRLDAPVRSSGRQRHVCLCWASGRCRANFISRIRTSSGSMNW
jgi:hypothetical protein